MARKRAPISWERLDFVESDIVEHPYRYEDIEHRAVTVLKKIRANEPNVEIAEDLGISFATVVNYRKRYLAHEFFEPHPDRIYREVIRLALESPEEWRYKAFSYVKRELNQDISFDRFASRLLALGGLQFWSGLLKVFFIVD